MSRGICATRAARGCPLIGATLVLVVLVLFFPPAVFASTTPVDATGPEDSSGAIDPSGNVAVSGILEGEATTAPAEVPPKDPETAQSEPQDPQSQAVTAPVDQSAEQDPAATASDPPGSGADLPVQSAVAPQVLLQTDGAGYFDTDGFTILPFQRNLVPYGDMLTDGGAGIPPGWSWELQANTVVDIAPEVTDSGVHFKVTAGADGAWAALVYQITEDKNWYINDEFIYNPEWDRTLEVGDRLSMAADIAVHDFSGTARHTVTLFDWQTYKHRTSGDNGAASGRFQTADGYGPLTDGFGDFRVPLGLQKLDCAIYVWLPALGDMMELTISDVVAQRIQPHAWQGTQGYTTAPANLGDVGTFSENDAPAGVATRRDGIGYVNGSVADLDLTQAWWAAVTFIPAWDSDLKNQLDGDLINIQADKPYQNIAGTYLFKKSTVPTPEDPTMFAQPPAPAPPIENYFIYTHWDGCTNTTRLHVGDFTFLEGDEIKVIMAFLPDGADGIAPGHHVWLKAATDDVITVSDTKTIPHTRQADSVSRVMLGYQNQHPPNPKTKADEEFAAWGKFRQWYVQQGTISLTEVNSYMVDNASLGIRHSGVYFALTTSDGMYGYGNDPQQPPYSFQDNFSDGDTEGWTAQEQGDWSVASSTGNNVYRGTRWDLFTGSWAGPATLGDQVVEAHVRIRSGITGGLMFRGSGDISSGSFYYFGIYPDQDKWKLFSVVDGSWGDYSPLAQGDIAINYDMVYRLKAEAIGDNITLYIDGQALPGGSLTDTDHQQGRFGFRVAWGRADFDNISAAEP